MPEIKIDDILQFSKINNLIKSKSKDEQFKNTVKIILICVGVLAIVGVIAYVVYRLVTRYDDYDLYDDLDYYYDDCDCKTDEPEVSEADFAE